jgi:ABC-type dipeptide/oligopeptide/nickel transport system permease subunit
MAKRKNKIMTERMIKLISVLMASPVYIMMIVVNLLLARWGLVWWQILLVFILFFLSGIWFAAVIDAEMLTLKENGYGQK